MLANTNIFTDKETTNWFKACIALNVTKDGLSSFVEAELQKIHTAIGKSCGQCSIEKLLPCPTNGMCKKRKGNTCVFHQSQQPQHCTSCDQVTQNITSLHRFNRPSWRNTQAERWAAQPWEIGKCFLPPDGYSGVSSVQESDFNGVISIMLNCTHFQTCLSPSCLSPPPPDKQCPLEKVRQIGRNIRHTSDCKVSDAHLLDYFQTLSTLLADPKGLLHDHSANKSLTKLNDLQNDRMSLSELGELLKEADRTLDHAKKAGERFSESAERAIAELLEQLESSLQVGEQRIEQKIDNGKQRIEDTIQDGKQRLEVTIYDREQRLEVKIHDGEQRIEVKAHDGEQRIESSIDDGKRRIEDTIQDGEQRAIAEFLEQLESSLQVGEQRIEQKIDNGKQRIEDTIQDGKQRLEVTIYDREQRLEVKIHDGEQRIEVKAHDGEQRIESSIDDGKRRIEDTIQDGEQRLEVKITEGKQRIMRTDNEQAEIDYTHGTKDFLRGLIEHYDKTLRHLPTSPLNDWIQARLDDVYMPPYLLLMEKDKGSFKKTNTHITKYKDVLNHQTFIQGEAGSGKTSFLAKLVMDWCSITKTTLTSEPLMAKETHYAGSGTRTKTSTLFDDLTILKGYEFVFYITLRDSVKQCEVLEMIKEQIIEAIYSSKEDREKAYKLVNEIMKHERCLVLLDGLDEWKSLGDRHNLPTLVAIHTQCDLVITTRPWKLAESKIPDSKIQTLLHLEGVNQPFDMSLRILRCMDDGTNSKDLENKQSEFKSYVERNNLRDLLASPMLLTLIVQTWAEGTELKGNRCQIYSVLLESLFKKANSEEDHFHETPFPCFKGTQYIKPNIEHLNRFSEAAFYFLFSEERETSLVFGIEQLTQYKLYEQKDFAMRAGILSAARKASTLRSSPSFSFFHKSVQEFLAAYYIACYSHVIDEVIFEYLTRHENSYLDISEVLIFLCGLNISAAYKLSILMNKAACECLVSLERFQDIILDGYREAAANQHFDVRLELSHFFIDRYNIRDLVNIWASSIPNVRCVRMVLEDDCIESDTELESDCIEIPAEVEDDCTESPTQDMQSSTASSKIASRIEFDLTSCDKLKEIYINDESGDDFEVFIKGSISWNTSAFPNRIVLYCEDSSPVLPCLERIELKGITVCSTWMRKLFNTQVTLDHEVNYTLENCKIITSLGDELISRSCLFSYASIKTGLNNTFEICDHSGECPGLWETLRSLDIKTLSILTNPSNWTNDYTSSLSQSLSSLKQLETLSIYVDAIPPDLWSALYSLCLKRVALSLSDEFNGLIISHAGMLSRPYCPTQVFDSIYIDVISHPDLLAALHSLNITSLSLFGSGESLKVNQTALLITLLKSLKQLYQVSIDVKNDSRGLWEALHGIHIKCLNIGLQCRGFKVNHVAPLLTSLSSLQQLEMIKLYVTNDISVVSEILHSLKIKSLSILQNIILYIDVIRTNCSVILNAPYSLNGRSVGIRVFFDEENLELTHKSLFQLLPSFKELEELDIDLGSKLRTAKREGDGLSESLRCLNIKTLSLKGYELDKDEHPILSQSLMSLTQLENLSIDVGDYIFRRVNWESLHNLNIKSLNLNCLFHLTYSKYHKDPLSLLSLTHLEILNIFMNMYYNLKLPQSLKCFNICCEALTPLELRDVIKTLSSCSQVVECKLEFGCARFASEYDERRHPIPLREYIPIVKEIKALNNFTISRCRILQRSPGSETWSVCNSGHIDGDDHSDDSANDEMYKNDSTHNIVKRILMRLKIKSASIT